MFVVALVGVGGRGGNGQKVTIASASTNSNRLIGRHVDRHFSLTLDRLFSLTVFIARFT
jgi:hypothetical protein